MGMQTELKRTTNAERCWAADGGWAWVVGRDGTEVEMMTNKHNRRNETRRDRAAR